MVGTSQKQKTSRRGRKNTQLYQKDLDVLDNPDSVVAELEPDILESEVKCALESTVGIMNLSSADNDH